MFIGFPLVPPFLHACVLSLKRLFLSITYGLTTGTTTTIIEQDTTPTWSTRGKLRRQLLPLLADLYGGGVHRNLARLVRVCACVHVVLCEGSKRKRCRLHPHPSC